MAATIFAAMCCGYLTLCFLFYQGQWQLVLHPTRTSAPQSPVAAAAAQLIHFSPDESAIPQLTGWWIPAAPGSRYASTTVLYLRGADGSLADSTAALTALHTLGINIFAFDYRGYGQSSTTHPSQLHMTEDADAAWQYLITSRAIPAHQIVPYGTGVGASIATHLAATHGTVSALILESPQSDLLEAALRDPRTQLIPARLLFHEIFPLAASLAALRAPKLLLSTGMLPPAFKTAADPNFTAELSSTPALYAQPQYSQTIARFLDQYLPPASVSPLISPPAPGYRPTP